MDENRASNPDPDPPADDFVVHDDLSHHESISAEAQKHELDNNQIKKIAHIRRTAVRSRGYLLVGSAFCAALGVQVIWNALGRFRAGSNVIGAAYLMAAAILFALAWKAFVRAQHLKREANASALSDPKTPPDFSQLNDGSQSWKNLEDM